MPPKSIPTNQPTLRVLPAEFVLYIHTFWNKFWFIRLLFFQSSQYSVINEISDLPMTQDGNLETFQEKANRLEN